MLGKGAIPDGDLNLDTAVIVALGANDKGSHTGCEAALVESLRLLERRGVRVVARSSWWASQAWPNPLDPPFLNGVAIVETHQSPEGLMAILTSVEEEMGRVRLYKNAPRTLDLDLTAFGRTVCDSEKLVLPHPRAADRLFVMGPLAEIAPNWIHPVLGQTAEGLAKTASVGVDAHPVS